MTKVIGDYTAAVTIDGSTNYLLIQPGNSSTAYNKINRNTLLGVSGQPADISTVQTIQNKVLDNTNTVTIKDSIFTLQDNSDTTKQAQFQLSGITTATTRTYTLPDATTTLVGTGVTQTLTNKTLTSPSITGGTYDNGTITVDSIGGHTSANVVTIAGLQINNGALNTNNSVVTANITDGAVTPAKLQSGTGTGWSWQSFTPSWTNLTIGNATVVASYTQIGKTIIGSMYVVLGSTSSMGSNPNFVPPVAASANYNNGAVNYSVGTIQMGNAQFGNVFFNGSNTKLQLAYNATATTLGTVDSTHPLSWTTGTVFTIEFTYQAA